MGTVERLVLVGARLAAYAAIITSRAGRGGLPVAMGHTSDTPPKTTQRPRVSPCIMRSA